MHIIRCANGHYYNLEKTDSCPFCGTEDPNQDTHKLVALDGETVGMDISDEETLEEPAPVKPILGWVVCVEGPLAGREFPLRDNLCFIGRSKESSLCMDDDDDVLMTNHGVIAYTSYKQQFKIDGRGVIRVNGQEVFMPTELKPYDRIHIGRSLMMFVPFCTSKFAWQTHE